MTSRREYELFGEAQANSKLQRTMRFLTFVGVKMIESIESAARAQIEKAFPGVLLLTREQAEQATGLCHKTLAKHVAPVKIGRSARWRPADLQKWIDSLQPTTSGV